MMQPLYRKLYAPYYDRAISDSDRIILEWWAELPLRIRPRPPITQKEFPDWIIYSDAATSTRIMACVVINREDFLTSPRIRTSRWVKANRLWLDIFADTNLILGLELVALVLTIADPDLPISDSCITCYVDNTNTLCALVRSDSKRPAIAVISRIFWAICAIRGIAPWLEWVASDFNIADLPTRDISLPIGCESEGPLIFENKLMEMAIDGLSQHFDGFFDPGELIGRLYTPHFRRDSPTLG